MVRRLNEGFKLNPSQMRLISKIYNAYMAIEDERDLRRSGMTHAEWDAFPDVFKQLQNTGYAKTFLSGIANYFKKNGFAVDMDRDGVNYIISFDGGVRESKSRKRPLKKTMKEEYNQDGGFIQVFDVDVNQITAEVNEAIEEAVSYIGSDSGYPTWHWEIGRDDEKMYCLVLGFASGYEPNDDQFTDEYGQHLAMKWGAISNRSAMSEYDMDFEMPYDDETGEVWDSETSVSSFNAKSDVQYVLDDFLEFANQYNANLPSEDDFYDDEDFDDDFDADFDDDFDESVKRRPRKRRTESTNRRRPKK